VLQFNAPPVDVVTSAICNKAASRIYFLKQLKRSSVDPDDLYNFYTTVIRLILEYACPVWHSSLTVEHGGQKGVLRPRHNLKIYFAI